MQKPILIITTGGTIDAEPYADPAQPPVNVTLLPESAVPNAIEQLGLADLCVIEVGLAKDSKAYTEDDLRALAQEMDDAPQHWVIVTHGTDATPHNARFIKQYNRDVSLCESKTIIFTGAMLPLSMGPQSDGLKNLKCAVEEIQTLSPGVYVVGHGQVLEPLERLEKDKVARKYYFRP
jgi:L-asparaginase/Glu-tRNA(Gln) amidotransferase subunit D